MLSREVIFQSILFSARYRHQRRLSFTALRAGPRAPLPLTAVAAETGSKQDSWESSLYYFLLLMSKSQNKLGQREAEASQCAVLVSRGIDWVLHPQNFWGAKLRCVFHRVLLYGEMSLSTCTSIMGLEVQRTGFADLKALPLHAKLSQTSTAMSAEPLNRRTFYISVICWWHQQQDYLQPPPHKMAPLWHFSVNIP